MCQSTGGGPALPVRTSGRPWHLNQEATERRDTERTARPGRGWPRIERHAGGLPRPGVSGAVAERGGGWVRLVGHPGGDRLDHARRVRLDPRGRSHVRRSTDSGTPSRHPDRWLRRPPRPATHADPRQRRGDRPVGLGGPRGHERDIGGDPVAPVEPRSRRRRHAPWNGHADVLVRSRRRRRGDECPRARQPRRVHGRRCRVDRRRCGHRTARGRLPVHPVGRDGGGGRRRPRASAVLEPDENARNRTWSPASRVR